MSPGHSCKYDYTRLVKQLTVENASALSSFLNNTLTHLYACLFVVNGLYLHSASLVLQPLKALLHDMSSSEATMQAGPSPLGLTNIEMTFTHRRHI